MEFKDCKNIDDLYKALNQFAENKDIESIDNFMKDFKKACPSVRKVKSNMQYLKEQELSADFCRMFDFNKLKCKSANKKHRKNRGSKLTKTKIEILQMIANGNTLKEIAEKTFRSEGTIRTHLNIIFSNLNVNTQAQAIATAFRKGLIK